MSEENVVVLVSVVVESVEVVVMLVEEVKVVGESTGEITEIVPGIGVTPSTKVNVVTGTDCIHVEAA